ncbi:SDR family NAD(P)-dependent oxidoreductase, partial [Nocardia flavorosea]|uniref:SDR family NAD(P)-dependent oxidoreductase n=1 Tax=Nocardia flavorosea TaxID=53429 RepID=UPI00245446B8
MEYGKRSTGRRILITGGAGGIGAAAARRVAAEGAAVAILDTDYDAAQRLVPELGIAAAVECDVTREESVTTAVAAAAEELGGLDGVLTCAGIARSGLPHEMSFEDWHSVIAVNLTGTFLTIRAAVPHLLEAGAASVVTIGSVASLVSANTNTCSYDASKSGVLGLTRSRGGGGGPPPRGGGRREGGGGGGAPPPPPPPRPPPAPARRPPPPPPPSTGSARVHRSST